MLPYRWRGLVAYPSETIHYHGQGGQGGQGAQHPLRLWKVTRPQVVETTTSTHREGGNAMVWEWYGKWYGNDPVPLSKTEKTWFSRIYTIELV